MSPADRALLRGRKFAAKMLPETVSITRESGTQKDADGRDVPTWVPVYVGVAGLSSTLQPSSAEVAGATVATENLVLKLPQGILYVPAIGDRAEFSAGSPTLIGAELRVTAPSVSGSLSVLLRVPVERVN